MKIFASLTNFALHTRVKQDKRTLYVGGLDEDVDVEILKAAFIPFGEVIDPNFSLLLSCSRSPSCFV